MSSTQALRAAATGDAPTERAKARDFPGMLEMYKKQIALALPKHMDADRMARIALTSYRMTPLLAKCDPASLFACVIQASQLGLEPGINGEAYLVPFYNGRKKVYECQLIPGYRGLIKLARNTAQVESVSAHVVYENDESELILGSEERLTHKPRLAGDRGRPLYAYCIARFKDGGQHIEAMTWDEIMAIKARSKSRNRDGEQTGPWVTDEMEMARKTVVRRASKYWPMSPELATGIALDTAAAAGVAQELDAGRILEGEAYTVPDDAEDDTPSSPEPAGKAPEPPQETTSPAPATDGRPKTEPAHTLESVQQLIAEAKDIEDLDYARSMIKEHLSPADQKTAEAAAKARAKELSPRDE